ncbi:MAG: carboxypeptidase-like regulatory domain-containing protein, partial [Ignavibacteria bacterium]|nr:carboxypeptidase-like regulatory domain-containing protein [Ignavibacteria bacterium]
MELSTPLTHLASRVPWILLPLSLCGSLVLGANGKITGRVVDRQTREPLPGANVVITYILPDGSEAPFDRRMGSSTDPGGYFFILNVPPGTYAVKASMIGYSPVIQKFVRVDLDRTVTVDFELTPSEIQLEQVVIEARQEVIKPDVAGTQEVIMTSRLEQMPVTRLDEFVNRVKGVELVSSAEGNGLSVRGGAIRETDVRLDGISL